MLRCIMLAFVFVCGPVIAWAVASGMRSPPVTPANPATMPTEGQAAVDAHMSRARALVLNRRLDEATEEYLWLWNNMAVQAPAYSAVRLSFTAAEMQRLADEHADARAKFVAVRDRAAKKFETTPIDPMALLDWLTLSSTVLQDDAAVAELIARVKDDPAWKKAIEINSDQIFDALVADQHWGEAGAVLADPLQSLQKRKWLLDESLAHIKSTKAQLDGPVPGTSATLKESMIARFRGCVGAMYASLLAATRDETATKLAEQARAGDASPAMLAALVSTALDAGQPRAQQREWIAQAKDASLRDVEKRLEIAVSAKDQGAAKK